MAIANQQPEANCHQKHPRVFSDQGHQAGGQQDQPGAPFHQAQHQHKHGQRQLTEIREVAEGGADQGVATEIAVGNPVGGAFRQTTTGEAMQHKTRSSYEAHLSQREGRSPEQPQQWSEEQQGWCEVLAKPFVIHRRQLSGMLHVGGELRGEGALEPMAVQAVPKHLLKNALVVAGQQDPGTPGLQAQADHGEQTSSDEDATRRQGRHLHASLVITQLGSGFIASLRCGAPERLS